MLSVEKAEERIDSASRNAVRIADVYFDLADHGSVLEKIRMNRNSQTARFITLVNPHSVMLSRRDAEMRRAVRKAWINLPDGVGIIVGARMLSCPQLDRTSGPELMLYLCQNGRQHGLRHYFYGGGAGVAEKLAARLSASFPGLVVAGTHAPPYRSYGADEDQDTIDRINAARPDILWVGLGAPKQESWMARHAGRLDGSVMIGVGAAFDFHSGNKPWCPALLRRGGLEWAYRLCCEPRRLWRRNLDSLRFLSLVASQRAAARNGLGGDGEPDANAARNRMGD